MRAVTFLSALSVMTMLVGCGGGDTVPISGTVTYNEKPVADALVTFVPVGEGEYGSTSTNAQGAFDSVSTRDDSQGLAPGTYNVTVSMIKTRTEGEKISYEPDPPPPFPGKYTDPSTTDLNVTVESPGPQTVELKMQG